MRVTVTFANAPAQAFILDDDALVDNLRYELIIRSTSPLCGKTGSFQAIHLAYDADKKTPLAGGLAFVHNAVYYADLPVCTVCREPVANNPFITSCGHWFHQSHLAGWVGQGKRNCPNCRTELPNTMNNVSVHNSAGVKIGQAKSATYTLDFTTATLTDFFVMSDALDPHGRYTIYAEYIAGVPADYPYQLPTMTTLIDPHQFAVPMQFTRVG